MPARPVYAFAGDLLLAHGPLGEALPVVHAAARGGLGVLVFDAATGKVIDLDLRGTADEALARLAPLSGNKPEGEPEKRGPGRPKLGVTPREVTLLPRHWDWLSSQPGGASVALRKLVEAALRETEGPTQARRARDATYAFMTAVAGDRPGYEEATRMLFAGDWTAFDAAIEAWPADIRQAVTEMAESSWRNGKGR
ncbi:DUF2239 family protein [Brevundimonas sp. GCM10030266]|uniref:DUF2239 family protein n=1 Tax=Brevundimonas sp. GCM10030266 TaxID=3273386 RepID=UPI00361F3B32